MERSCATSSRATSISVEHVVLANSILSTTTSAKPVIVSRGTFQLVESVAQPLPSRSMIRFRNALYVGLAIPTLRMAAFISAGTEKRLTRQTTAASVNQALSGWTRVAVLSQVPIKSSMAPILCANRVIFPSMEIVR